MIRTGWGRRGGWGGRVVIQVVHVRSFVTNYLARKFSQNSNQFSPKAGSPGFSCLWG